MPKSPRWSNVSVSCRLEWRPSRWVIAAMLALSAMGSFSVLASDLPRAWAWPMAAAALVYGSWLARRETRKPVRAWFWPGKGEPPSLDGVVVADAAVHWRGSLAFVCWRDARGRRRRLSWWPDTLPPAHRRELRLAAPPARASRAAASMAP